MKAKTQTPLIVAALAIVTIGIVVRIFFFAPPVPRMTAAPPKTGLRAGVAELPPAPPPQAETPTDFAPPAAPRASPDMQARAALALVGADSAAEQYWIRAINNPALPDNERKNLIEDLNEAGLANPRNPTADDVPLIVNRLQLIDQLAPAAMDSTNAAAFQEARKDLINMVARLLPAQ
ncbi:MAG: hypothetical protein WCL04_01590 [Verrucomicrobiota bacterium]